MGQRRRSCCPVATWLGRVTPSLSSLKVGVSVFFLHVYIANRCYCWLYTLWSGEIHEGVILWKDQIN